MFVPIRKEAGGNKADKADKGLMINEGRMNMRKETKLIKDWYSPRKETKLIKD